MIAPIDLPDLEAERDDEDQDGAEREEQTTPAEHELGGAGLPGAIDSGDDLHAVGENRRDARRVEAMHLSARERQLAARFAKRELLVTHLDARILQMRE